MRMATVVDRSSAGGGFDGKGQNFGHGRLSRLCWWVRLVRPQCQQQQ